MSFILKIRLLIIVLILCLSHLGATQTNKIPQGPYDVILYDAETIVRINDVARAPTYPRDISHQYDEYVLGIPVMTDPKSCGSSKLDIRIKVENVGKSKGYVVADIHNHVEEDFLDPEKVVIRVRATAVKGITTLCVPLTQPGDYAIAVYHDKNGNRRFDKGFLRIPKERFGISNNPKFKLAAPSYQEAAFTVTADETDITIKLVKASDILGGKKNAK